jgi:hypothetical protein
MILKEYGKTAMAISQTNCPQSVIKTTMDFLTEEIHQMG